MTSSKSQTGAAKIEQDLADGCSSRAIREDRIAIWHSLLIHNSLPDVYIRDNFMVDRDIVPDFLNDDVVCHPVGRPRAEATLNQNWATPISSLIPPIRD